MVDAWINCNKCGNRYGSGTSQCPQCGATNGKSKGPRSLGRNQKIAIAVLAIVLVGGFAAAANAVWNAPPSNELVAAAKDANAKAIALLDACAKDSSGECERNGYVDNLEKQCADAAGSNTREYLTYCNDPRLAAATSATQETSTALPVSSKLVELNNRVNNSINWCSKNWDSDCNNFLISNSLNDCGQLSAADRKAVPSCNDRGLDQLRMKLISADRYNELYRENKTNSYIVDMSGYVNEICSRVSADDCQAQKAHIYEDCYGVGLNPFYTSCYREDVLGMQEGLKKANLTLGNTIADCMTKATLYPWQYAGNSCDWYMSERIPKFCEQNADWKSILSSCSDPRLKQYLDVRNLNAA